MSPIREGGIGVSTAGWLQRLVGVALKQDSLRGLEVMAEVLGEAAKASGVILWEQPPVDSDVAIAPSLVTLWLGANRPYNLFLAQRPDRATMTCFETRTLILTTLDSAPRWPIGVSEDAAVKAALPVDFLDGGRGAVTLLGDGPLEAESFDLVVELLEVIPALCATVRERQTLALSHGCSEILHQADLESPDEPLLIEMLSRHFDGICDLVAEALQCSNVTLFLKHPDDPEYEFPVRGFHGDRDQLPQAAVSGRGPAGWAIEHGRPTALPMISLDDSAGQTEEAELPSSLLPASKSGCPPRKLMVAPLRSGSYIWGALVCSGAVGPPFLFTESDLDILEPSVNQIAQYWSGWLRRTEISSENRSWRNLASGITEFNRVMYRELERNRPIDEAVYSLAWNTLTGVVPDCDAMAIQMPEAGAINTSIKLAPPQQNERFGTHDFVDDPAAALLAQEAFDTGQQTRSEWRGLGDGGGAPSLKAGWVISTPVRVNRNSFGVMTSSGGSASAPLNSPQGCEIVADEIALYHHLSETLGNLRQARAELQSTVKGQAQALEDLEHQLVSPLLQATVRTDGVLAKGRFDPKTEAQLRAIRGLCRKASRVAMSAGVFAALSKGLTPQARLDFVGPDDLVRILIAAADDVQSLADSRRQLSFQVGRSSVLALRKRLVRIDRSFFEQCVANILDNAAKYCYDDTTTSIEGVVEGSEFRVRISSTGIPLSPAEIDRCRLRNWRSQGAKLTTGEGSGIGLWIVDNLMQALGGELGVSIDNHVFTADLCLPISN